MNYLKAFVGIQPTEVDSNGNSDSGPAATISTLCGRLASSQLISDRRDAIRALKSLSKRYRTDVGTVCLDQIVICLLRDRNDHDLISLCLETLCGVFVESESDADVAAMQAGPPPTAEILNGFAGKVLTDEIFSAFLSFLEESDFSIRFHTVNLLIALLQLRGRDIQQLVLLNPTAVARFMDLLSDVHEVIRNEVLLLLTHLTKTNSSIQKIIVFENAFNKVFTIMASEGYADGGIVTADCLELLLNLLTNNSANQVLFREDSCIQHFVPFFDSLPSSPTSTQKSWTTEKTENFVLLFQLIRCLVVPGLGSQQQQVVAVERIAYQCGLLQKLASLLTETGLPAKLLMETLGAVGELARDLPAAQDMILQMTVPGTKPPRPLIVVLLMTLVNDKQPLPQRLSIMYCLQCLLHNSLNAQSQLIGAFVAGDSNSNGLQSSSLNNNESAFQTSASQLLVSGLLALDSPSAWLKSAVLTAALGDSRELREKLLKAELVLSLGAQPVTLLKQATSILAMQKVRQSTRIGLLQVLCAWLAYSPVVVSALLKDSAAVSCIISQVGQPPGDDDEAAVRSLSAFALGLCIIFNDQQPVDQQNSEYNRDRLLHVVSKRIGTNTFGDALRYIASCEDYGKALRTPRPIGLVSTIKKHSTDEPSGSNQSQPVLAFTHEFCQLYQTLEPQIQTCLAATRSANAESTTSLLYQQQYQTPFGLMPKSSSGIQLSADQHQTFEVHALHDQITRLEGALAVKNSECERLTAELAAYKMSHNDNLNEYHSVLAERDRMISQLQSEVMSTRSLVGQMQQMQISQKPIQQNGSSTAEKAEHERLKADYATLRQEQEDLMELLSHQDSRLEKLRSRLRQHNLDDSEEEEENDEGGDGEQTSISISGPGSIPGNVGNATASSYSRSNDSPNKQPVIVTTSTATEVPFRSTNGSHEHHSQPPPSVPLQQQQQQQQVYYTPYTQSDQQQQQQYPPPWMIPPSQQMLPPDGSYQVPFPSGPFPPPPMFPPAYYPTSSLMQSSTTDQFGGSAFYNISDSTAGDSSDDSHSTQIQLY